MISCTVEQLAALSRDTAENNSTLATLSLHMWYYHCMSTMCGNKSNLLKLFSISSANSPSLHVVYIST